MENQIYESKIKDLEIKMKDHLKDLDKRGLRDRKSGWIGDMEEGAIAYDNLVALCKARDEERMRLFNRLNNNIEQLPKGNQEDNVQSSTKN